jgi:predicted anti-sigma-YlaC factor YlaD
MACTQFEDLLLDYEELAGAARAEVDSHVAVCAECRAFLETLAGLDARLTAMYAGVTAPARFRGRVLARTPRRLSRLPEMLDFAGWAAVAGVAAALLWLAGEALQVEPLLLWAGGAAAVTIPCAVWTALRSWAEMKG